MKNEEMVTSPPQLSPCPTIKNKDVEEKCDSVTDPVLYYTPDEEESDPTEGKFNKTESTSYVPPFNNPLYPNNTSYTSYGSVIGKYCLILLHH